MTKLGWISAILFLVQAAFFGLSISDFNRFAEVGSYAYDTCDSRWGSQSATPDDVQRLNCIDAAGRNIEENRSMARLMWAGLVVGSALTLLGVYKGRRDA